MNKEVVAEMEYKIKVLLAWKELAEEAGNKWAANIASKHIITVFNGLYDRKSWRRSRRTMGRWHTQKHGKISQGE